MLEKYSLVQEDVSEYGKKLKEQKDEINQKLNELIEKENEIARRTIDNYSLIFNQKWMIITQKGT